MGVIHWSTTTLKPLRGNVSNTDHLITMQCSAGKPWVLRFMWMPLDMHHTSQNRCTPSTTPHGNDTPLMAAAPQQDNAPTHYKNCSGMAWGAQQKARGVDLANKFTRSQSNWASVGRGETSPIPGNRTQWIRYKRPSARHHRTPLEVSWPCLDRSELFWLRKGILQNTKQVV